MFRASSRVRDSAGFSMIEVMVAGGLVAFMAIALLPAVFNVGDTTRSSGFKAQCQAMVRGKLQEYLNGVADTSMGNATDGYVRPTGFEYTKRRYQLYSNNCSTNPTAGRPGFREAIYSNVAGPTAEVQELAADGSPALSKELLGFQLWVMLRHYNPRVLTSGQPTRGCHTAASPEVPYSEYQFLQVGDGIEVTVTGMIRVRETIPLGGRGNRLFGKLDDLTSTTPNPALTCSVSEIIYPPRLPFRYYLNPEGKILNLQAKLANNTGQVNVINEAAESHFRSVWKATGSGAQSNIRGFAVSPDNKYVYVMRPGELARYGPCYERQVTVKVSGVDTVVGGAVTVNGKSFVGMPDCPTLPSRVSTSTDPGPDGLVWNSDTSGSNIDIITVDFNSLTDISDDEVYGFPNSGATNSVFKATGLGTATISWTTTNDFALPSNRPRIRGIFLAQTFPSVSTPNLFFYDNSCYTGTTNVTSDTAELRYCTSIYSSADTTMQQEMREVPVQVDAIAY